MNRKCIVFVASATWLLNAHAFGQEAPLQNFEGESVAQQLDNIIESAIDGGLLTSTKDKQELATSDIGLRLTPAPSKDACNGSLDVDFAKYGKINQYADLTSFQYVPTDIGSNEANEQLAKLIEALLSLGLFDEARGWLSDIGLERATFYQAVVDLLQFGNAKNSPLLEVLDLCYEADFWRSIALLANNSREGVSLFGQNLQVFRGLPFYMRVHIALVIVPILGDLDARTIADSVMANFTIEEIEASQELRFLEDLGQANAADTGAVLLNYLDHDRFRAKALSVVSKRNAAGRALIESVPVEDLVIYLDRMMDEKDKLLLLDVILRGLASVRDFEGIIELGDRPDLTSSGAQSNVVQHLGNALGDHLADGDFNSALEAIGVMLEQADHLRSYSDRATLYDTGIKLAKANGYNAVATRLLTDAELTYSNTSEQSELDASGRDIPKEFVDSNPRDSEIVPLAVRQALAVGDSAGFRVFESQIAADAGAALNLLEADVLENTWFASNDTWLIAGSVTDNLQQQRFDRLTRMRDMRRNTLAVKTPTRAADAHRVLPATADWLQRKREGAL